MRTRLMSAFRTRSDGDKTKPFAGETLGTPGVSSGGPTFMWPRTFIIQLTKVAFQVGSILFEDGVIMLAALCTLCHEEAQVRGGCRDTDLFLQSVASRNEPIGRLIVQVVLSQIKATYGNGVWSCRVGRGRGLANSAFCSSFNAFRARSKVVFIMLGGTRRNVASVACVMPDLYQISSMVSASSEVYLAGGPRRKRPL
eukprot:TRINITY_DN8224_c0_g1_i4.p1 TRINITY_DN8224_c0_g1~~TRINITY_DN8224_c0_g1_i4.p1  ORF type:complete len:198 (+),score=6.43 TRINITY_DN8224_c0_g1_i4:568-1161(+)